MAERPVGVPWPAEHVPVEPFDDIGDDRFNVFVPAIMSVGVLFSITTLLRDFMRWVRQRRSERAIAAAARGAVATLRGTTSLDADALGLPSRRGFVAVAGTAGAAAVITAVVAVSNYDAEDTDFETLGFLLAAGIAAATVMTAVTVMALSVVARWPHPPSWTIRPLSRLHRIGVPGRGPSKLLTAAIIVTTGLMVLLAMLVLLDNSLALEFDRPVLDWIVGIEIPDEFETADIFGSTVVSIGLVVLVAMSGFRCRVMAVVYPTAFVVVWLMTQFLHEIIERTRPLGGGEIESFPSGHLVQSVFIAGMVSTAAGVLLRSTGRTTNGLRVIFGVFVLLTAFHRIHRRDHWPLDAVAGILLGLVAVLVAHWLLEHRGWHHRCASCPWSEHPAPTPWRRGVFDLAPATTRRFAVLGIVGAFAAGTALLLATQVVGLPTSPEGDGLGDAIANPAQIALAAMMVVAAILAFRWKGVAALLMIFCAAGIGLLASIEYSPAFTVLLAAMLLIPAVLTWLAWQPHETLGSIALLAVFTVGSLTGTTFGSREIYSHYFGPSHPSSIAAPLDSEADWLWVGAVGPTTATVVAAGLDAGSTAGLSYWSDGEPSQASATASSDGIARFELAGLSPVTEYSYVVRVSLQGGNDSAASSDIDGSFRTFPEGASDLTIVLGSCARNESNGLVFDRMVGHDPDLYLALGDLHYANLESTNPTDHLRQYGRSLSQPGQAALFSSVPTAYVWDDHDFGPNDADASSPTRTAVSTAYRSAVPNYGVDPDIDASIAQAFTIGRVRVVMTDTRSQRSGDTMLGEAQLLWFLDEIRSASQTHALVVWANPTPWISSAGAGADDWSAFPEERRHIADAIAEANIDNLIMVSGDAHMVAIDDGSNSGYASDGSPGFPLLHAAALDRPGNAKGGPYSHGSFPGGGQYGVLEIIDDGGPTIIADLVGRNWEGEELVRYRFTADVPAIVTG